MSDISAVERQVHAFIEAQLPDATNIELRNFSRATVGLSRENWIFDASWIIAGVRVDEPLIMRRDPAGSVLATSRRVEFDVLKALEPTAVLAPRVHWLDEDGSALGRPTVVMRREAGECEYFCLNHESRDEATRVALAHEFLDGLCAITNVDWRSSALGDIFDDPGLDGASAALDHWEGELRRVQREPLPEIELVLTWLRARAPKAQATVLVHGDFKPGNALVRGDHLGVVLDWETAHLGDPLEDLGWITNPVRRREHQIPGVWEVDQIAEYWSSKTGYAVDRDELRWWNVLANYKLAVIGLTGVAEFIDGNLDRPYSAPLSLCRIMYDLMGI